MEVILLEKVAQLGDPGDLVNVKAGYGRNFLIPSGKAVRADEKNKAEYEKKEGKLYYLPKLTEKSLHYSKQKRCNHYQ